MTAPRVVVAGGHSAGHIEPAMNVADALRRLAPTAEITALGTVRGLDATLVPARGYPLELIPPVPLPRRPSRALLRTPGRLRDSVRAAGAVLDRVRAEVVVGLGGYVAVPAYLAARSRGLPIVIHEANARPGVANRLAARMTTHVFTAAPGVRLAHATAIGIPLRPAITGLDRPALRDAARRRFGLRPGGPVLMRGGEQRLNAEPVVAAGGALLVDDADLDPAWIETTLIPVLTDPGRIATMSAHASAAGAPDADVVLARHVLRAIAERRAVPPSRGARRQGRR